MRATGGERSARGGSAMAARFRIAATLSAATAALALLLAGCGGSSSPAAVRTASTAASRAAGTNAHRAPLTCTTVVPVDRKAFDPIAILVADQKLQDASQTQNWVNLTDGSLTSQGSDLEAAEIDFTPWDNIPGGIDLDTTRFDQDANTFLTDQSSGLMPGWVSEYRAVQHDVAALAKDCGISYTIPAGE